MAHLIVKPARLLWSGGFDSTVRLISHLANGRPVEPIYLDLDPTWQKDQRQRHARTQILEALPAHWRNLIRLPPEGEAQREIWEARDQTLETFYAEKPHDWRGQDTLVAAAGLIYPGIEVCYVQDDTLGRNAQRLELLREHGLSFPVLDLTKRGMLDAARIQGWAWLLGLTWTCEADNDDARLGPCGTCEPCRARIAGIWRSGIARIQTEEPCPSEPENPSLSTPDQPSTFRTGTASN